MDGTTAQRLLGVSPEASRSTVRNSYRSLAKAHHPDIGGDAARFRLLNQAYGIALSRASADRPAASRRFFSVTPSRPREQRTFAEELALAMGM
jgi:DnaJ domain